jgi:hypothetical protein
MTLSQIKELWENNQLAIYNRKNKATFEAMQLLHDEGLPYIFYSEEQDKDKEVNNWQGLRSLDCEYVYNDGSENLSLDAIILEPEEINKLTK